MLLNIKIPKKSYAIGQRNKHKKGDMINLGVFISYVFLFNSSLNEVFM